MDTQIIQIVSRLQVNYRRVYPWMVQAWMDEENARSEATLRRYMRRLAGEGKLVRLGERRGYMAA